MATTAAPDDLDCTALVRACEHLETCELADPATHGPWHALDRALRRHLAAEEDAILPRFHGVAPAETAALRAEHAALRAALADVEHELRHGRTARPQRAALAALVHRHADHEHGPQRERARAIAALCEDADAACEARDLRELAELAERLAVYAHADTRAKLADLVAACRAGHAFDAYVRWQRLAPAL